MLRLALLLLSSTTVTLSQNEVCLNGGEGPCINGACLSPTQKCIKDANAGEMCCELTQISSNSSSTTPSVSSAIATSVTSTSTIPVTRGMQCFDKLNPKTGKSDCPSMARLCADGNYNIVMHIQCPKTCGRCDTNGNVLPLPLPVVRGCSDFSTSQCLDLAQYCLNPVYKELMRQMCPSTCGFCY